MGEQRKFQKSGQKERNKSRGAVKQLYYHIATLCFNRHQEDKLNLLHQLLDRVNEGWYDSVRFLIPDYARDQLKEKIKYWTSRNFIAIEFEEVLLNIFEDVK